ncbi:MAG: helicase-related protein [Myxococcota bacterium]|nr:helicase-related protein [Myxococcota bacterium]
MGVYPVVPGNLLRLRNNDALGPVRLVHCGPGGVAEVEALHGGANLRVQLQALAQFPLYRGQKVCLKSYDRTQFEINEVYRSETSCRHALISDGTSERSVPESHLVPLPPVNSDVVSFLECLRWTEPHDFFARAGLAATWAQWFEASEGLPTLRGARIRPLAHQLHAAQRILQDRVPRFVLADEVGLGKTIEAGLVIQALLSSDPELRVLVVAPGSMSRQWLFELYLRFGGRAFAHVSAGQLQVASARERRRVISASRLIVSSTALLENAELREAITTRLWDLVVVDEAHQLPPGHPLFGTLQALAARSPGFLALSATPSKRELRGLAGLLSLVAPESYSPSDVELLRHRMDERRQVWGVLNATTDILAAARQESEDGEPDADDIEFIVEDWQDALPEEPEVAAFLKRALDGETQALDELVAYVQENYRIDHRILRTRRRTLGYLGTAFAPRELQHLEYRPSPPEILVVEHLERLDVPTAYSSAQAWLRIAIVEGVTAGASSALATLEQRLGGIGQTSELDPEAIAESLSSDPGPDEEGLLRDQLLYCAPPLPGELEWLEQGIGLVREWELAEGLGNARHRALCQHLAEALASERAAKVLVFAQRRTIVEEFAALLAKLEPSLGVDTFHHGQDHDELERIALRFQRSPDLRVLVSDELGGEGRNFQVADWVVHLDTPFSVGRIEQRIGRLDRMGREDSRPVRSILVRGPSTFEQALQDLHEKVFGVFTASVGGLEFVLPRLQRSLREGFGRGVPLAQLADTMQSEVEATLADVDEDFELSLDSSREQLKQAQELAEMLEEPASDEEERMVRHWLGSIGVRNRRDRSRGTISFQWTAEGLSEPLRGYGNRDGSTPYGTFNRSQALRDESLQFFGPGHRLVDAALAALPISSRGRAAVMLRRLGRDLRGRVFVVCLGSNLLRREHWPDHAIPAGLKTRAHRFLWPSADTACVEVKMDGSEPEVVRDFKTRQELTRIYERDKGDRSLDVDQVIGTYEPATLWAAVRAAVATGHAALEANLAPLKEEAAEELEESMRTEIGYYHGQIARGVETQADAEEELNLRERILRSVREAHLVLEGVCVVIGD